MLQAEFVLTDISQIIFDAMIPAVLTAGEMVKQKFIERDFNYTIKTGNGDLVTDVDLISSDLIKNQLTAKCPNIHILDEEYSLGEYDYNKHSLTFIVDPIDGSLNFYHGFSEFSISLGLVKKGQPVAGVVYKPFSKDLYYGIIGEGAYKNNKKIYVNTEASLCKSLLATGIPYDRKLYEIGVLKPLKNLLGKIQEVRVIGSAAAGLCYVAEGVFSGFYEFGLSPWDIAGGISLVIAAGGKCYTKNENENIVFGKSIIAGNEKICAQILKNI